MSATLLSSFLVFIASGVASLFWIHHTNGWVAKFSDGSLPIFIFIALIANAIYFYYYSALTELHAPAKEALKSASRMEWVIRVLNHTLMLLLWPTFVTESPWVFGACLFSLYATFIVWDILTYSALSARVQPIWLIIVDVLGFLVALGLGLYLWYWMELPAGESAAPVTLGALFGAICAIYSAIALAGICLGVFVYKFNPFSGGLYARDVLH